MEVLKSKLARNLSYFQRKEKSVRCFSVAHFDLSDGLQSHGNYKTDNSAELFSRQALRFAYRRYRHDSLIDTIQDAQVLFSGCCRVAQVEVAFLQ